MLNALSATEWSVLKLPPPSAVVPRPNRQLPDLVDPIHPEPVSSGQPFLLHKHASGGLMSASPPQVAACVLSGGFQTNVLATGVDGLVSGVDKASEFRLGPSSGVVEVNKARVSKPSLAMCLLCQLGWRSSVPV